MRKRGREGQVAQLVRWANCGGRREAKHLDCVTQICTADIPVGGFLTQLQILMQLRTFAELSTEQCRSLLNSHSILLSQLELPLKWWCANYVHSLAIKFCTRPQISETMKAKLGRAYATDWSRVGNPPIRRKHDHISRVEVRETSKARVSSGVSVF